MNCDRYLIRNVFAMLVLLLLLVQPSWSEPVVIDAPATAVRARQYLLGEGVEKDAAKAAKLYLEAAQAGDPAGLNGYGVCLRKGLGVAKDEEKAVECFLLAAKAGSASGCLNLSACLEEGIGVQADLQEAIKWAREAKRLSSARKTEAEKENYREAETRLEQLQARREPEKTYLVGSGTGFFISEDGYLLTCAHVADGRRKVVVYPAASGEKLDAKVVAVDKGRDLAILKVEGTFSALPLGDSDQVKLAQEVFTVGFPNIGVQGVAPKYTKGDISALSGARDDQRLFQISVPVQPGNSGGPLATAAGNVVGVVSAQLNASGLKRQPQNVNYAIKAAEAQALIQSVPGLADKLAKPAKGSSITLAAEKVQQSVVLVALYVR